ncbi:MAG: zf-TFIIB domain-containing protein [Thermodesulfovibrionales bacterium]
MKCPVCNIELKMSDRQGIEIDYCPQCRGVWLDRGLSRGLLPINMVKIAKRVNTRWRMMKNQNIMDMNMDINTSTRRDPFLKKSLINIQLTAQMRRAYGMDNRFSDMA